MNKLISSRHLAEARFFAIILTFSGGFIDAYTYMMCNHTMAAAQTGNIIFLSVALASHNFIGVIDRLGSLIGFVAGFAVVGIFHAHIHYWRVSCLFPIVIIGIIVGFLPENFPPYISVPAISFGLAMQNAAFNKIEGLGYSNVFTSGNIKKAAVAWSEYSFHHDHSQLHVAWDYFLIVISFTTGAIVSANIVPYLRMKTIWLGSLIILTTNLIFYFKKAQNEKKR